MKKQIINYQYAWKLEKVKIKNLVLDINNVRLETEHGTQDEIINDLFLNEDAMSVLESIYQNGYFPDEPPVVVKEDNKYVVLDGNRRIVSLKAMLSPAIAPSKYIHRIEKLMTDSQPIEDISVHVATSRNEAMEYLAAKHTKTTRKAWSALRRAYFYYAQKEQGQSVEKLIERYKGVDIPSYIKMYEMHNVALALKHTSQEIKAKAMNKRTFPISTLERFYSDSYVQNKKKSASAFKPPTKPLTKKKDILVSSKFVSPFDSPGIGRVLWELQTLDYIKFPNAAADLLRTFLEITIKKYLEDTGGLPTPTDKNGKKKFVMLSHVLAKIKSDFKSSSNTKMEQVVQEIEKNKWYLDSINHNPDVFAVGDRVKDAWDQVYPLIKHIFEDYQKQVDSKK